ncbi:class I adenylate-forming enzyme family protein [Streptomyces sp. NPDC056987]|uniref:class I adenylate-forming enzyme family protein n=1 Tax=Streptomyces sp. NPDC056987 TaxID=3345988 RepID=UPI00363B16E1
MSIESLYEAVRAGAGRHADTALLAEGRTWAYGELLDAADAFAAQLRRRPESAEPLVAELADPVGTAVVTLGCDLAGVALVHRDPSSPAPVAGPVVHDGRARAVGPDEVPCFDGRLWLHTDGRSPLPPDLPDGAQIFLTSGSTGTPRAVVRTVDAVRADALRVAGFLGYAPDAPVVCSAPFFHAYGFNYGLMGPLLTGATVRWCPSRTVPSQLARSVQECGARTLIALPAHYGLLAASTGLADPVWDTRLATLRAAVSAGAPLAAGVAPTVVQRFTFGLYNCYGSSEAGAVTLTPLTGDEEGGWIGAPLPGVTARVEPLDEASKVGELLLRTTSLAALRLGPRGTEPLARDDGWYPTGDLALAQTPGGGIRLVGRVTAVINVAGKKVSPGEVERVLAAHPQVADVQVVAAADPARGQVPVARVVLLDESAASQLTGWCRQRLAPHQVPRRFDMVEEIPRSATGKPLAVATAQEPTAAGEAR